MDFPSLGLYHDYSIGFRNASGGQKQIKQGDTPRTETSWEQQATRRSFAVLEFNLDGSNLRVFA
jgi:hypothetical protein